jgi:hypothetical protein
MTTYLKRRSFAFLDVVLTQPGRFLIELFVIGEN